MNRSPALYWLPVDAEWRARHRAFHAATSPRFADAEALARHRLDFVQTNALAQSLRKHWPDVPPADLETRPIRLAVLSSSTADHLAPSIAVAAARRGLWVDAYLADYGQYLQELTNPDSGLRKFRPNVVLFAFDEAHLTSGVDASLSAAKTEAALAFVQDRLRTCWSLARDLGAHVVQQTVLPTAPSLMGGNEHLLPGSRAWASMQLNMWMREAAKDAGVDLLALDARVALDGRDAWHDPALWHRSKQEVTLSAAPMYGELLARMMAAAQGRSRKCLVLDLDNTLWGGCIGDDGLDGIVLGQGSPQGEAFVALQLYVRELSRRGVILAVCSKNDAANALEVFDKHPDMVLRRADIACFVANWQDKASNLRAIAAELKIGLDALTFLDDNPFERNLVRRELPMVEVPELGEDPAYYPQTLADAGYFEALSVSEEDHKRATLYQENSARESVRASATDMEAYLRSLDMKLVWQRFDEVGIQRVTQLINKTNQFNLTTRRYTEHEVRAVMSDPGAVGLQFRLLDRFGDNGVISIVIGRAQGDDLVIDTWLMSCRVLGRQVERGVLNVLASEARRLGLKRLLGEYKPTSKNGMVKDHYAGLGFSHLEDLADGGRVSVRDLAQFEQLPTLLMIEQGDAHE